VSFQLLWTLSPCAGLMLGGIADPSPSGVVELWSPPGRFAVWTGKAWGVWGEDDAPARRGAPLSCVARVLRRDRASPPDPAPARKRRAVQVQVQVPLLRESSEFSEDLRGDPRTGLKKSYKIRYPPCACVCVRPAEHPRARVLA